MQLAFWALRIRDIEMKNRIKELRKKKHLTLKELSQQLKNTGFNISPDTLGKYERAERSPKILTFIIVINSIRCSHHKYKWLDIYLLFAQFAQ